VEAGFTAGQLSTDGGALLLREVERKINLLSRAAACFTDGAGLHVDGGTAAAGP
jgi:hypothetical protein